MFLFIYKLNRDGSPVTPKNYVVYIFNDTPFPVKMLFANAKSYDILTTEVGLININEDKSILTTGFNLQGGAPYEGYTGGPFTLMDPALAPTLIPNFYCFAIGILPGYQKGLGISRVDCAERFKSSKQSAALVPSSQMSQQGSSYGSAWIWILIAVAILAWLFWRRRNNKC
jgi:hypothetical protein